MPTGVYERQLNTIESRLFNRVFKTASCWLWQGSKQRMGHGQIANGSFSKDKPRNKLLMAHRVAYELYHGPIPPGMCVCHRCDVPSCVNPSHLFLGTKSDNSADMKAKGRQKRGAQLPQTKLTEADVRAIRASADTYKKIAERFGVASSHVCNIKKRRLWAHLD